MAVSQIASEEVEPSGELRSEVAGRSPWALAGRRLLRNKVAMVSLGVFLVIVAISFAAPLYAHDIAHTNPFESNLNGTTVINGHRTPVMQQGGGVLKLGETPIGPTWQRNFLPRR